MSSCVHLERTLRYNIWIALKRRWQIYNNGNAIQTWVKVLVWEMIRVETKYRRKNRPFCTIWIILKLSYHSDTPRSHAPRERPIQRCIAISFANILWEINPLPTILVPCLAFNDDITHCLCVLMQVQKAKLVEMQAAKLSSIHSPLLCPVMGIYCRSSMATSTGCNLKWQQRFARLLTGRKNHLQTLVQLKQSEMLYVVPFGE